MFHYIGDSNYKALTKKSAVMNKEVPGLNLAQINRC